MAIKVEKLDADVMGVEELLSRISSEIKQYAKEHSSVSQEMHLRKVLVQTHHYLHSIL